MSHVDISALREQRTPFGRWRRLNPPLGLDAFGINAIDCEPGEDFDIDHDEGEGGPQEAYVVVAGRAEFRIGDEVVEARPGVVVAAPDPTVRRSYRALEPGTRIVCIGAQRPDEPPAFGSWIDEAETGAAT